MEWAFELGAITITTQNPAAAMSTRISECLQFTDLVAHHNHRDTTDIHCRIIPGIYPAIATPKANPATMKYGIDFLFQDFSIGVTGWRYPG